MSFRRSTCNSQRAGIGKALMATARCQPNTDSPPAAGPLGVQHSQSPVHTAAPDFLFNASAELPIQEEDEANPEPSVACAFAQSIQ